MIYHSIKITINSDCNRLLNALLENVMDKVRVQDMA